MRTSRAVIILALGVMTMAVGCGSAGGGLDLSKLPPIVIAAPAPSGPTLDPAKTEAPKPRASVGFIVTDAEYDTPIKDAIVTIGDHVDQVNDDGYLRFELEVGTYDAQFEARDYKLATQKIVLKANRNFFVKLESTKTKPAAPAPPPLVESPTPPVVPAPTASPCNFLLKDGCPAPDTTGWSDEQWKQAFFALLKKHGNPRTCNLQSLNDTRADIEALGAEWQHTSGGELRPRLFLPVAPGADPYSRPFDVGFYGQQWDWIKRY